MSSLTDVSPIGPVIHTEQCGHKTPTLTHCISLARKVSFWRVSFTHLYTTALSLLATYHTCHRDNQMLCRNIQFCKMPPNCVCHKRKLLNMKWCDTLVSLIQTQHLQTEICSFGVIWQVRLLYLKIDQNPVRETVSGQRHPFPIGGSGAAGTSVQDEN